MSNHDVFALFIPKRLDDYIVKSLRHERRSKTTGLSFAEVPQMRNQMVWASRKSRKRETKWFWIRGTSANEKLNGLGPAEVPQTGNQIVWASRKFRR